MVVEILAPISIGELFDKISILEIKLERILDPGKLANIRYELNRLREIAAKSEVTALGELPELVAKLKAVNAGIWEAEDTIRDLDRRRDFGDHFLRAAQSIYRLNDERAATKRAINALTSSAVIEEKSYTPYASGSSADELERG